MSEPKEMRQKVTLSLPVSLVERAKIAAIRSGRTLSDLVAEGLRPVVDQAERRHDDSGTKGGLVYPSARGGGSVLTDAPEPGPTYSRHANELLKRDP